MDNQNYFMPKLFCYIFYFLHIYKFVSFHFVFILINKFIRSHLSSFCFHNAYNAEK